MKFRIFTNDRGKVRGVPMYSAYTGLTARSAKAAEACFPFLGPPDYAPVKAIEWPPTSQTSKDWLAKHT